MPPVCPGRALISSTGLPYSPVEPASRARSCPGCRVHVLGRRDDAPGRLASSGTRAPPRESVRRASRDPAAADRARAARRATAASVARPGQQRGAGNPGADSRRPRTVMRSMREPRVRRRLSMRRRAVRARSASTRQMVCTRSSISTTGISSTYASSSAGSSRIDCSSNSTSGRSASTPSTTARASSQRWHPGLPSSERSQSRSRL